MHRSPGIPSKHQVSRSNPNDFSFCNWYHCRLNYCAGCKINPWLFWHVYWVGAASGMNGSQFWPPPIPNKPSRAEAWLQHCSISCLFLVVACFVQAVLEQQEGTLDRTRGHRPVPWSAACLGGGGHGRIDGAPQMGGALVLNEQGFISL